MFKKVLIPLDGSRFAERVLMHIPLFVSEETELSLLQVIVPQNTYYNMASADGMVIPSPLDVGRLEKDVQDYLNGIKGELRGMGYHANGQIAKGDVAAAICDRADAQEADLIAMTTHGRSGVSRWLLGSIAERVIRNAKQPLLLVRTETQKLSETGLQRILVPLDGSELAEVALQHAQRLAQDHGVTLLLVQSIEPVEQMSMAPIAMNIDFQLEISAKLRQVAQHYLEGIQQQLEREGLSSDILVVDGAPANAILDIAEAEKVDLIAMSTHGRSGLNRWVFGSVADKVLRHAKCPLLVIRAKES
jgi:nucleotide-binding universal stress UspA family protein